MTRVLKPEPSHREASCLVLKYNVGAQAGATNSQSGGSPPTGVPLGGVPVPIENIRRAEPADPVVAEEDGAPSRAIQPPAHHQPAPFGGPNGGFQPPVGGNEPRSGDRDIHQPGVWPPGGGGGGRGAQQPGRGRGIPPPAGGLQQRGGRRRFQPPLLDGSDGEGESLDGPQRAVNRRGSSPPGDTVGGRGERDAARGRGRGGVEGGHGRGQGRGREDVPGGRGRGRGDGAAGRGRAGRGGAGRGVGGKQAAPAAPAAADAAAAAAAGDVYVPAAVPHQLQALLENQDAQLPAGECLV